MAGQCRLILPDFALLEIANAIRCSPRAKEADGAAALDLLRDLHLDVQPLSWELSADRANAARRVLEASGLPPDRITRVVGYADRQLANPADPLDAANRRIRIIVRFQSKQSRRGEGG